jgi:hypothetical protein
MQHLVGLAPQVARGVATATLLRCCIVAADVVLLRRRCIVAAALSIHPFCCFARQLYM